MHALALIRHPSADADTSTRGTAYEGPQAHIYDVATLHAFETRTRTHSGLTLVPQLSSVYSSTFTAKIHTCRCFAWPRRKVQRTGHSVDPLTETSSLTELLGLTFKCQTAESFFAPPPHLPPPPPTSPPLSPSPKPPPFSPFTLLLLGASTLSPAKEARATELPALRP
eukprot:6195770-Pleurochrysis_carterae.AAC.1